ncbi:MAG: ABC transporter substrate-binding protein [Desulfobacterales bacterium]|nr:ABC transporter substrate-binding protein [Desulfobacterales bacterium]
MKNKFILIFILISLISCDVLFRDEKEERIYRAKNSKGDILIGAVAPWEIIRDETNYLNGIEMAVSEINQKEKVLGRKIKIITEDDEKDITKAQIIANSFAKKSDIVAVIGHFDPQISNSVSIIYEYSGILMLTPTFSDANLTNRGFKYIFRTTPSDEEIGKEIAEFLKKNRYIWSLIFYLDNPHGWNVTNKLEVHLEKLGFTVADRRAYGLMSDVKYFRKELLNIQRDYKFNVMVISGTAPQAGYLIKEARNLGIDVPIVGSPGLASTKLLDFGEETLGNVTVATFFHPDNPNKKVQSFTSSFEKKIGKKPDVWAAQGYDAVHLLAYAMQKAGTTDPEKVSFILHSIKNWEGVTGNHTFDYKGNMVQKKIIFQTVKNNSFEFKN